MQLHPTCKRLFDLQDIQSVHQGLVQRRIVDAVGRGEEKAGSEAVQLRELGGEAEVGDELVVCGTVLTVLHDAFGLEKQ